MTRALSREFLVFAALFAALSAAVPSLFLSSAASVWAVLLLEALLLSVALELSELIAAAAFPGRDLPRLESLGRPPRVAVVFLVCDDLVPRCLEECRRSTPSWADFFVLDDSQGSETRQILDRSGLRVVRRAERRGYKAGSLNHWLRLCGDSYDYFLVLDSDSLVPAGFLEALLLYAEHPGNARVAVFNTLSQCWNAMSPFPRLLSGLDPVRNWLRLRLSRGQPSVFSTGHNNLHRTAALREIGGFNEDFLAEDLVATLDLWRAGYTSKLVGLVGGESEPEHVFGYMRRLGRWTRQTVQALRADWRDIPLGLSFQMFKLGWMYFSLLLFPAWILAAAWSVRSTGGDLAAFTLAAIHGEPWSWRLLANFGIALLLLGLGPLLRQLLARRLGISCGRYWITHVFLLALGLYGMLAVVRAQVEAALASTLEFPVTDKRRRPVTLWAVLRDQWPLVPFSILVLAGFCRNVVGLAFSALWLPLLIFSPLLVYLGHRGRLGAPEIPFPEAGPVEGAR